MNSSARPNVLFIITDQHRADHLGCYGNAIVRTPNIDGLAARGWSADRFYVSSPICMPNRSTLMTGRMPSVHGVRHNGIPLSLEWTTFPDVLRAAGYATALLGKAHLQNMTTTPPSVPGPDAAAHAGSPPYPLREARHRAFDPERYEQENPLRWRDPGFAMTLPFYGFEHVALCTEHGDLVEGEYGRWLRAHLPDADLLRGRKGAFAAEVRAPQAWRTRIPEHLYPTTYVADQTIAWLEQRAAASDGKPFFAQCSFPDPHHPFTPPGHYWDMYDPDDMPLPPSFRPAGPHTPPHVAELQRERDAGTAQRNTPQVYAVDEREARESIALTYGMIAMIDDAVGRVLARLSELGLAENTIVIFTSDHGDFMGDHQLMLKGPLHFQGIIRTPFIWYDPQRPAFGKRSSELAGTIDIAQTILERAGLGGFNGMQGRSLLPAIADVPAPAPARQTFLIEEESQRLQMGFTERARLRTLLSDRYRISVYAGLPWGELYDLSVDPHELTNRWADPSYAGVRGDLLLELTHAMLGASETSPHPTKIA
jgi:arylsulfatase A-like enzyme